MFGAGVVCAKAEPATRVMAARVAASKRNFIIYDLREWNGAVEPPHQDALA